MRIQDILGKMTALGFDITEGDHPIVPIMLYDAVLTKKIRRITRYGHICSWFLFSCSTKR